MSTTIQVRDVIQPPQAWYDWINSPERELAMRGQLAAADAAAGDVSATRGVSIADSEHRIRDVGAPLDGTAAAVIDLRTPHAAMLGRWAAHDGLLDDERAARAKAAGGGAGEVLDLSSVGAAR